MIIVMKTTVSTGASSGTVTRRKTVPLRGAVGACRLEHVARHRREAGPDDDHREAGPDPDVRDDQRRRDQLRAEPGVAAPRLGERLRRDAGVEGAGRDHPEVERPVVAGRRGLHHLVLASAQLQRSRRAGRALPASTFPGTPPPGLKSRQTTPEIWPGARASAAPPASRSTGTSSGGIPVSPSSATPFGWSGVFSTIPVCR